MKSMGEFCDWLEREGRHQEIIVSTTDWARIWERVAPAARVEESVLLILGRRIRPALSPVPLDVSDRNLFD